MSNTQRVKADLRRIHKYNKRLNGKPVLTEIAYKFIGWSLVVLLSLWSVLCLYVLWPYTQLSTESFIFTSLISASPALLALKLIRE